MLPAGPSRRIAVVVKGYPRLSETFIAQEMLALQRRGLKQEIWSLRHPTDPARHPMHRQIRAPVTYLPEYLYDLGALEGAGSVAEYRSRGRYTERALAEGDTPGFSAAIRRGVPGIAPQEGGTEPAQPGGA